MITAFKATPDDFQEIAQLIVELSKNPATQCVHAATGESIDSLTEEMVKWHQADEMTWAISKNEGSITGVMGCEFEREAGRAWLRGPFALEDYDTLASQLWDVLLNQVPKEVTRFDSFLNIENTQGQDFYKAKGFLEKSRAHVYVATKNNYYQISGPRISNLPIIPLAPEMHASFAPLHDTTFPGTYITGSQIIDKLDETHRVWIHEEEGKPIGYLYGVIESWAEEGYIEFVGVAEQARGRGIGGALLHTALDWFFNKKAMPSVGLTVDNTNTNARSLYERVGFQHKYSGVNQRLEIDE